MRMLAPWLLLLAPPAVMLHFFLERKKTAGAFLLANIALAENLPASFRLRLYRNLKYLRAAAIVLVVIALARPQSPGPPPLPLSEGIDIMLAVDVSSSMMARDLESGTLVKSRLELVKDVIRDFISVRPADRIGLVAFASRAYLLCPPTLDHDFLLDSLERIEVGLIEDGTSIGAGLMSSLNRLRGSDPGGKVVVLLTDGRNNMDDIPPMAAAATAQALHMKIYTIGVGSGKAALYPAQDQFGKTLYKPAEAEIDEASLTAIAGRGNGRFFRAADSSALKRTYEEIDRLEKRKLEQHNRGEYTESFPVFLVTALLLLAAEMLLKHTLLRKLP